MWTWRNQNRQHEDKTPTPDITGKTTKIKERRSYRRGNPQKGTVSHRGKAVLCDLLQQRAQKWQRTQMEEANGIYRGKNYASRDTAHNQETHNKSSCSRRDQQALGTSNHPGQTHHGLNAAIHGQHGTTTIHPRDATADDGSTTKRIYRNWRSKPKTPGTTYKM